MCSFLEIQNCLEEETMESIDHKHNSEIYLVLVTYLILCNIEFVVNGFHIEFFNILTPPLFLHSSPIEGYIFFLIFPGDPRSGSVTLSHFQNWLTESSRPSVRVRVRANGEIKCNFLSVVEFIFLQRSALMHIHTTF